ncbi:MAG: SDR family oxidoreductase [Alphaproteobacteria bacterium]|nr:SDR family oxidoreductase [Alphaproteobacteria bacterium]
MTTQTVLVTGGASGIGLASVGLLNAAGHNVVACDIQADKLARDVPKDPKIATVAGDVTRKADCDKAVAVALEKFGRLDALLHWAGIHDGGTLEDMSEAEWDRVMAINVKAAFLIAQAAARPMVRQGAGAIVLTSSTSVLFGGAGGEGQVGPAYVASKAAIIGLTRSLARGLGPKGVRVNAVSPGITETPMIGVFSDNLRREAVKRFPLGRFGRAEEIAAVGCFLISDGASFMTGEVVHVNGGSNFG